MFNTWPLFLISGIIILFVMGFSLFFLIRAYRAGVAMGMDKHKLRRAVTSSATFSLLPSISILLGVIALSVALGVPLPWLRLSVIGALHYEMQVADIAAKSAGLSGVEDSAMTAEHFVTIALVMAVGIIWGAVCMMVFGKSYCNKLQRKAPAASGKKGFGDSAMTAMFIGLITAYMGSYLAKLAHFAVGTPGVGDYLPVVTMLFAAAAMAVFCHFSEKKNLQWLENFSIAGSMFVGMAAAVVVNLIVEAMMKGGVAA